MPASDILPFTARSVTPPKIRAASLADSVALNAQLAAIIENSADAIFSAGLDDRILSWNPGAAALFGYAEDEAIGRTVDELIVPEHLIAQRREVYRDVRAGRMAIRLETQGRRKDGSVVSVEVNASPMFGEGSRVIGISVIMRDVAGLKTAQEATALLAAIVASSSEAIISKTLDGVITSWNASAERLFGYSADEQLGQSIRRLIPAERQTEEDDILARIGAGETIKSYETVRLHKSGAPIDVSATISPVRDATGRIVGASKLVRAITDRKAAEAALAASEARFRQVAGSLPQLIWTCAPDGPCDWLNPQWVRYTGIPEAQQLGYGWLAQLHPDDREPAISVWQEMAAAGKDYATEFRIRRHDGAYRWFRTLAVPMRDGNGAIQKWFGSNTDIHDIREAEASLLDSEARYRALVEDSLQGIVVHQDSRIVFANPAAARLFAFGSADELLGRDVFETMAGPEDRPLLKERTKALLAGNKLPPTEDIRSIRQDGRELWIVAAATRIEWHGRPAILAFYTDITDRKKAEERLRAAHDTFRQLVDRSPFGVYVINADFRLVQVSEGAQKVFENVRPLVGRDLGEVLRILWPEPFANEAIARFRHTLETGEPYQARDMKERRADIEATEAYDWKIERIAIPDGRFGVVCHFYDLSERQRHEEQIQFLLHEVNHRSKNMLSLVYAVARQTAARHPKDFIERFGQRIQALSANQDLLVRNEWKSVRLDDLVRSQLAHFGDEHHRRVALDGPPVNITASASQALGMALHELATNAAKYGALSNEAGRIEINWHVRSDTAGMAQFTLAWVENGGPPVAKPRRRGFGSTVISDMVKMGLNADVTLDYAPAGVAWRIDCPADGVLGGRA